MSGAYAPLGTGGIEGNGLPSVGTRATLGSISAMAFVAARRPLPIAVRRPVVRLRMASRTSSWSSVGGWTTSAKPLKATTPIWVLLAWWAMKSDAACSAACRRVGAISEVSEFVEVQRPQPLDIVPPSVVDSARCHYLADAPFEHLLKRRIGRVQQAHQSPG